jgi:uncharacterized membrane protein YhaH (DUF805 family)
MWWMFCSLEGRLNRSRFWLGVLGCWLAYATAVLVASLAVGPPFEFAHHGILNVREGLALKVLYAGFAPLIWCMSALAAKRWHDRGKSVAYLLVYWVPFIGPFWAVIEPGLLPGTDGPNKFGPDPLATPLNG